MKKTKLINLFLIFISLINIIIPKSIFAESSVSLVKDIFLGSTGSSIDNLVKVGDYYYFSAKRENDNYELWRTDGTSEGTVLVKEIYPGDDGSFPSDLVNLNGTLYFLAQGLSGPGLWKSDGTEGGTEKVFDNDFISNLVVANNSLFFTTASDYYPENSFILWKSDGNTNGTVKVKEIFPGYSDSDLFQFPMENLIAVGNKLFFTAYTEELGEDENHIGGALWVSDGTPNGTFMVKDTRPDFELGIEEELMLDVNGTLFFSNDDMVHGEELWKSDGTVNGTVLVKDIFPGDDGDEGYSSSPESLTNFNGILVFSAESPGFGVEVWKSDGTEGGTVMIKDIAAGDNYEDCMVYDQEPPYDCLGYNPKSSYPTWFSVVGDKLFFTADDYIYGAELWKSDGTEGGTEMVFDIYSEEETSDIMKIYSVDGKAYFSADDGDHGYELWKSDGTEVGTQLVYDLEDGSSYPSRVFSLNGAIYFVASRYDTGFELWKVGPDDDIPPATPTPTPPEEEDPEPTPTPEDQPPEEEPDESTPTPEPESTPSPQNETQTTNTNSSSNTLSAPVCTDTKPISVPDLFQINVSNNTAKVYFTPAKETNSYYISFSQKPNAEEHGSQVNLLREGVQSHQIYQLKPNTVYYFKVRAQNGCVAGDWSNTMMVKTNPIGNINPNIFYKYFPNNQIINTKGGIFINGKNISNLDIPVAKTEPKISVSPAPTSIPTAKPKTESNSKTTEAPKAETKKFCIFKWCW